MKSIILIQCHVATNSLLYTVEKALNSESAKVFVHVDLKSNLEDFMSFLPTHPRLYYVKDRVDVRWGHISQFLATIKLLELASQHSFDYASLISGDDIMISSMHDFECFLSDNRGNEFFGISSEEPSYIYPRVKFYYPELFFEKDKGILQNIYCKAVLTLHKFGFLQVDCSTLPKLYKGSCWFTLTENCILSVLAFIKRAPWFIDKFNNSFCADEVILQTILCHLGFKETRFIPDTELYNDNLASLRYIDWSGPEYPKVLEVNDFESISNLDCFFARKISRNISYEKLVEHFG